MASVGSVGFYSQLTARNKAIGGLATGLDTDSLVEALTMSTRNRLSIQSQQKTLLNWKVSAYRSIANTLRSFQTSNLSLAAGSKSLKSQAFFDVFKGTSSSSKITINAAGSSQAGSVKVDEIKQIATHQTFSTGAFSRELAGNDTAVGQDYIGKTLQVSMNGTTKTIKLDALQGLSHEEGTGSSGTGNAFAEKMQALIDNAFGENVIKVNHTFNDENNTFKLKLEGGTSEVTIKNTADSLGLEVNMSNRINLSTKLSEFLVDENGDSLLIGDTFKFSINDTVITVGKDDTVQSMMTKINTTSAGVNVTFNSITESFTFSSKAPGAGDNLRMQDVQGNLLNAFIGAKSGNSFTSEVGYTNASKQGGSIDVSALEALVNDEEITDEQLASYKFKLTVGSTSVTLSLKDVRKNMEGENPLSAMEAIEKSLNDQLKSKFSPDEASFKLGDNGNRLDFVSNILDKEIKLDKTTGKDDKNALELLGLSSGSYNSAYSMGYTKTAVGGAIDIASIYDSIQADTSYKMDMTIGGVTKTVTIKYTQAELDGLKPDLPEGKNSIEELDAEELETYNKQLASKQESLLAFKLNNAKATEFGIKGEAADVQFYVKDGKLNMNSKSKSDVSAFSFGKTQGAENDLFELVKGEGVGNMVNNTVAGAGTKLSDIGIEAGTIKISVGGTEETFTFDENASLSDFMNTVNERFGREIVSFASGKVTISGGTQDLAFEETDGNLMSTLFGQSEFKTVNPTDGSDYSKALEAGKGQNAIIVVGGKEVISTTNDFEINGISFTVNSASKYDEDGKLVDDEPINLNVTADPDNVVDKIKNFITEYNTLVDALYTIVMENPTKGYEPLTDEQKAEMTEEQIKNWENEAKKGLLRNDSTLRGILNEMRSSLYEKVEASGLSLYDVGITTESYSDTNNGKLEMTDDGEKRLREMLVSNPDAVRELFTNSTDGIAARLDKIITNATNTSSTSQGTLVALAGTDALTGNNESVLSRKLDNVEKQISLLQKRLETEYSRYWKRFSNLETTISNFNTQSSWLSSFGG